VPPVPDFIRDLRQKIGHDLLWLPGVTAVVLRDDEVLLTRRADTGAWHLVSGILEPGEQPARAAVREIREETGVEAVVERLSSCWSGDPLVVPTNGDQVQFLDLTFRCRYVGGDARVGDDENLEVGWFALDDLPPLRDSQLRRLEHARLPDGAPYFLR
jgi:8-oxo-dGTP pyrophosphatase MutT (NUDIX family)